MAQTSSSTVSAILNGTWQQRRISEETAQRILQLAQQHEYRVNRQASGLRKSRSGLIGMIIPTHEDRYFGTMSQVFDAMARERRLQPIVVSTLRDTALEAETVRTLISYQIDHLIVCGATDPDAVGQLCAQHKVQHVNVDLPGDKAPSILSDSYWGATQLTNILIDRSHPQPTAARDQLYFIGGITADFASQQRMLGFSETVKRRLGKIAPRQIRGCGYDAAASEREIERLCTQLGGLPRGILFHSTTPLEGALRYLKTLHENDLRECVFCSFDWHPFASYLRFPVHMTRQDVEGILGAAFKILDGVDTSPAPLQLIRPHLLLGD
jgi:LacI family fructose operon transcriptional repressor